MLGPAYNPRDWYWLVAGDTDRVWSSKARGYVPTSDAGFQAWGGQPTAIASEDVLWDVVCPMKVTNTQARYVLRRTPNPNGDGTLFDAIDLAAKTHGGDFFDAWEYANEVFRKGSFVAGMAANFGVTPEMVRALFWAAAEVSS